MARSCFAGIAAGILFCVGGLVCDCSFAQQPANNGGSPATQRGSLREPLRERLKAGDETPASTDVASPITATGDHVFAIEYAGQARRYRMHVPASYSPSRPTPLVLSFHGGGGNMEYQANDTYYGQISKSEQAGFIAVFPNGYSKRSSGRLATWNAGNCCAAARDQKIDDVGFVRTVIENLRRQLNIDGSRIFANGISNGGMMSYRLACEMSDVFAAIASVAGTDNTQACAPKSPVSILHIHARDDERVLFNGGAGRDTAWVTSFVSVADSTAKWVRLDGCSTTPVRVFQNAGAYCDAYPGCKGGAEVKLCVTETGGHSWPGGTKPRGDQPPSTALSATDVTWDFFSRHSKPSGR